MMIMTIIIIICKEREDIFNKNFKTESNVFSHGPEVYMTKNNNE